MLEWNGAIFGPDREVTLAIDQLKSFALLSTWLSSIMKSFSVCGMVQVSSSEGIMHVESLSRYGTTTFLNSLEYVIIWYIFKSRTVSLITTTSFGAMKKASFSIHKNHVKYLIPTYELPMKCENFMYIT